MRQLSGNNLLGSLGEDIGECGRGLIFLDKGGGVSMLFCACCVKELLSFVAVLVGLVGSRANGWWLENKFCSFVE